MPTPSEWQGSTGDAWAEEWRRTDRTLAPLNPALLARILPLAPAAILDVGCGAGATSLALADALPEARITGLDLSEALVAAARARSEGRPNLAFASGDASRWRPADGAGFDLVVSRHGIMFFEDPVAAFAHLRGLVPRLLFSCFRSAAENEWMQALMPLIARHAPAMLAAPEPAQGPFAFADPARIEAILTKAGFAAPRIEPVDFDFQVGAGDDPVAEAVAYFRRIGPMARLRATLGEEKAGAFLADIEAVATAARTADKVSFRAAAWIVSSEAS